MTMQGVQEPAEALSKLSRRPGVLKRFEGDKSADVSGQPVVSHSSSTLRRHGFSMPSLQQTNYRIMTMAARLCDSSRPLRARHAVSAMKKFSRVCVGIDLGGVCKEAAAAVHSISLSAATARPSKFNATRSCEDQTHRFRAGEGGVGGRVGGGGLGQNAPWS